MATAVLTPNNRVVKLSGNDRSNQQSTVYSLENLRFEMDGTLIEFTSNNKDYMFLYKTMFFDADRKNTREGFCLKSKYAYYKDIKNIGSTKIKELLEDENWFDSHFESATKGDTFTIEKVETDKDNFQKYYTRKIYSFEIIDFNLNFFDSKQYPSNTIITDKSQNRLNQPDGLFFQKNFKNKINQLDISESSKTILYKGILKICFEIYWVVENTLDILAIKRLQEIITLVKSNSSNIVETIKNSNYTTIDKTIAYLLLDFGYRDIEHTLELAPIYENDQYYDGLYQPFENYYNALVNFYENLNLRNEQNLFDCLPTDPSTWPPFYLEEQSKKRMVFIKDVLPISAITLIFQFEEAKYIFDDYIKRNLMGQHQEAIALKIIYSLYQNPKEGEKFLDYLLESSDSLHTNFELIYHLFDDEVGKNSLGMFSGIYDFFAREKPNRRNFIFALFKIWQNSKYNFYYQGDGQVNGDGINLESYFFTTEGKAFFTRSIDGNLRSRLVFEFDTVQTNTWQDYEGIQGDALVQNVNYTYNISKELAGKLIKVDKITTYDHYITTGQGSTYPTPSKDFKGDTYKFDLHLYQPMFVLGYKGNLELQPIITENPYIPSFVFYYYEDFDRLKDLQAGISFAVDTLFEVSLFFLSGGASSFSKIRYLKYFTEIGTAIRTGSTAANTALIITGLEVVADTMTVVSSVCGSYYNFMKNTASTPALAKQYEETSQMFFNLTLYAAGASMATRFTAGRFARKAFEKPNFGTLPEDVQGLVKKIMGIDDVALNNFRTTKLTSKPNIATAYDGWLPSVKRQFFEDFKNLSEADLAMLDSEVILNNWKNLLDNNIADRLFFEVISNEVRTNRIIVCYKEYKVRQRLSALTTKERWKFFDEFLPIIEEANTLNKLGNNAKIIDLVVEIQKGIRVEKNALDLEFASDLLKYDFNENFVDFFITYTKSSIFDALYAYTREIQYLEMPITRVKALFNGYGFIADTSLYDLKKLQSFNTLVSDMKVYNNNSLVTELEKKFISGKLVDIKASNTFTNNIIPSEITEVSGDIKYGLFSRKALDLSQDFSPGLCRHRFNDTEMKMLYDLFTNHWHQGNRIVINVESLLDPCNSCSLYFGYLKIMAKNQGKALDLKVISNTEFDRIKEVRNSLK